MSSIFYKKRREYKYILDKDYRHKEQLELVLRPPKEINNGRIVLTTQGFLTIKKGYAWDGPSGPTIDTPSFMRGSLVHDALYQLMREDRLSRDTCRNAADRLLRDICRADGMYWWRRAWVYAGVYYFGASSAASDRLRAPR